MNNEVLAKQINAAAAALQPTNPDPLMVQTDIPAEYAEYSFQSLFRGMAYYLKFQVEQAKNMPNKRYGVFLKSLDDFLLGAFIEIIDNDGEDSVVLNYTTEEEVFAPLIEEGAAISVDDPKLEVYLDGATSGITLSNGAVGTFGILTKYRHTVYVLAMQELRHYIEVNLDATPEVVVDYPNLMTVTGYIDENGVKKIKIEPKELISQMIKNDDQNEVAV